MLEKVRNSSFVVPEQTLDRRHFLGGAALAGLATVPLAVANGASRADAGPVGQSADPGGIPSAAWPLNVKAFGAKGDNVTDDTAAVQAAFDAQRKYPYSEVVFPAGSYHIRDTIKMYSPNTCGQSPVNIYQDTPGKDIFHIEFAWRGTVRNLGFNKGAKQLNMGNPDIDMGLVRIENCIFAESSDFAVYMREGSSSTHLIVQGCVFSYCGRVLHAVCDWTTLCDGWIETTHMHNHAAIENHSAKLLCANIVGVPALFDGNDRWIDNYGGLTCRNFRFGGESGGMTPVYNFARLRKNVGGGQVVILDDCWISAAGGVHKCAVYLEEIPNSLIIQNCNLTVPAIITNPRINPSEYFKHALPGMLQFVFNSNVGLYNDDPRTLALLQAARNRDRGPGPIAGQLSAKATRELLAEVVARVEALRTAPHPPGESNGHKQKMDPKEYLAINTHDYTWDLRSYMDATTIRNSQYIAMAQTHNGIVFMRRAPDGPGGTWPDVEVRNVTIDLDKYPWLSWKQRDPGPHPLPPGVAVRTKGEQLAPGITMPMGFAIKIKDNQTGTIELLFQTYTPPWFDYGAKDLRKIFGLKGGKRTFTIKYYPLGTYITGRPGSGSALPGDYQILEFIRAEAG